ncbi:hypothetical protein BHE74_00046585 [Ensete ventricosum]|nr:hypothetical protein BHE74_00046585 [Ensete ventricosum]
MIRSLQGMRRGFAEDIRDSSGVGQRLLRRLSGVAKVDSCTIATLFTGNGHLQCDAYNMALAGMITCSATNAGVAAYSAALTRSDGRLRTKLPHEGVPPVAGAVALG